MIEIFLVAATLFSIVISLHLATRVADLHARLSAFEMKSKAIKVEAVAVGRPFDFKGRKVALVIEQDHPTPIFENILKDQLLREGASVVKSLQVSPGTRSIYDLVISGRIGCDGFADVYYESDLVCSAGADTVCVLVDRPLHGERPLNLAKQLIERVKEDWNKTTDGIRVGTPVTAS